MNIFEVAGRDGFIGDEEYPVNYYIRQQNRKVCFKNKYSQKAVVDICYITTIQY
jgi:hypothetical protein